MCKYNTFQTAIYLFIFLNYGFEEKEVIHKEIAFYFNLPRR